VIRIIVVPSAVNGLRKGSQLMVDKLFTVPIGDIGSSIGCLEITLMAKLELALRDWLYLIAIRNGGQIACLKRLLQRRYNARNASGPRQELIRLNSPGDQILQWRSPYKDSRTKLD
jgi:hypothetical protein